MNYYIQGLKCPNCGATVSIDQTECDYCGSRLFISSFYSIPYFTDDMLRTQMHEEYELEDETLELLSKALCLLKLRMFKEAEENYKKIISENINNDECFFLLSIAMLEGKKPFLHKKNEIDEMILYIENAILLKPKGIYYLVYSYFIKNYYEKKKMRYRNSSIYCLEKSSELGVSEGDKQILKQLIDWEEW